MGKLKKAILWVAEHFDFDIWRIGVKIKMKKMKPGMNIARSEVVLYGRKQERPDSGADKDAVREEK